MKKRTFLICLITGAFFGQILGDIVCSLLWPTESHHVCQCEHCKLIRQLEAIEVVDSVIQDRIVINISKED